MQNQILAAVLFAAATSAGAQQPAAAQQATTPSSALQAKCIELAKPTLKGAERIRDIGSQKGKVDQDVWFRISANGGPTRTLACEVQTDGSLKLINK